MLVKPDLIMCWPTHLDYPGFRYQLKQYRDYFNKVIVVWHGPTVWPSTEEYPFLMDWIKDSMKSLDICWSDLDKMNRWSSPDWFQRYWLEAISNMSSEYLFNTHQDLIIKNEDVYLKTFQDRHDLVGRHGYRSQGSCGDRKARFELDFFFIKLQSLLKTSNDVTAKPPKHDHLGSLSLELKQVIPNYTTLNQLGFSEPDDFEHLEGLGVKYIWTHRNLPDNIEELERFRSYNEYLLSLDVEQCPLFIQRIQQAARIGK